MISISLIRVECLHGQSARSQRHICRTPGYHRPRKVTRLLWLFTSHDALVMRYHNLSHDPELDYFLSVFHDCWMFGVSSASHIFGVVKHSPTGDRNEECLLHHYNPLMVRLLTLCYRRKPRILFLTILPEASVQNDCNH